MKIQNKISEFFDFLYDATIGGGVPIIRSTNNGKAINPYL